MRSADYLHAEARRHRWWWRPGGAKPSPPPAAPDPALIGRRVRVADPGFGYLLPPDLLDRDEVRRFRQHPPGIGVEGTIAGIDPTSFPDRLAALTAQGTYHPGQRVLWIRWDDGSACGAELPQDGLVLLETRTPE